MHPLKVILVPDGAYHNDAGAVLRVNSLVRYHLHPLLEDGGYQGLSDEVPVLLIIRVYCDELAGGQKFRPCGGYGGELLLSIYEKADIVQFRHVVLVLDLGIGQSGHAARAPVYGELALVNEPLLQHLQECYLRNPAVVLRIGLVVDGGVHALAENLELVRHIADMAVRKLPAHLDEFVPLHIQFCNPLLLLHLDLNGRAVHIEA